MTGRTRKAVLILLAGWLAASGAWALEIRRLTKAEGLPSNWVTALAAAPDGKLWVGTGDAGVALFDPATGKGGLFDVGSGLTAGEVSSIALFQGKVYVGTASGLSVFDGSRWSSMDRVENVTLRNVRLAASPDGKELWACSVYLAGGTVRFDGTAWKFMGGEGRGLFNDVQGFAFGPEGVLMGAGSGAAYLHKGTDVVALKEGLPPVNVFSAGIGDGKWLLGTSRGLFRFDKAWKPVPMPKEFEGSAVFSIATRGSEIFLGTDRGLAILGSGKPKGLTAESGLPSSRVNAVAVAGDAVAAGTAGGIAMIR